MPVTCARGRVPVCRKKQEAAKETGGGKAGASFAALWNLHRLVLRARSVEAGYHARGRTPSRKIDPWNLSRQGPKQVVRIGRLVPGLWTAKGRRANIAKAARTDTFNGGMANLLGLAEQRPLRSAAKTKDAA
jgi:hypothetical protein